MQCGIKGEGVFFFGDLLEIFYCLCALVSWLTYWAFMKAAEKQEVTPIWSNYPSRVALMLNWHLKWSLHFKGCGRLGLARLQCVFKSVKSVVWSHCPFLFIFPVWWNASVILWDCKSHKMTNFSSCVLYYWCCGLKLWSFYLSVSELQEEGINAINLPLSPSHYELDPEDTMLGNLLRAPSFVHVYMLVFILQ